MKKLLLLEPVRKKGNHQFFMDWFARAWQACGGGIKRRRPLPWPALLLPGALLLLDIASLAAYLNSVDAVGFKARGILALAGCMLLLTVAVALLPCATSVALLLCALPTALLAPFQLVRMHYALSLALYTLLLVWALAAPYLWAQLTAALR